VGRRDVGAGRLLLGTAIALGSYTLVRSGAGRAIDERAQQLVARPLGAAADRVIAAATDLGSVYGVAGVAAALAATGRRDAALDVAAAGAIAWSAAQAAKPLLQRQRPYELVSAPRLVAVPAGSSWPSGHAAVVSAMAAVLSRRTSTSAARGLWAGVAAIGVSRLYVGVHHLTDVTAGVGVGLVSAGVWSGVRAAVRRSTGAGSAR
jgi:membrane-associated phospholipid phosphatase